MNMRAAPLLPDAVAAAGGRIAGGGMMGVSGAVARAGVDAAPGIAGRSQRSCCIGTR